MPYFATSQEWLHQSSLLLEARPTTTRITTKYHISKPKPRRTKKAPTSSPSTTTDSAPTAPRGSLTLKAYDPHSGACLKYRTTKAAEVSRLIQSLGRPLGARMAALPLPEAADEVMADAPLAAGTPAEEKKGEDVVGPAQPEGSTGGGKAPGQGQAGGGGGGGKGKKKRGKK